MSYYSLAYIAGFTAYLFLAVFALSKNLKSRMNRVCAAFIACFAVWTAGLTFMVSADDAASARLWANIASIGWCSFPAMGLWFTLILTKRNKLLGKWFFYPLVFAFPAAFIYAQWAGLLTDRYIQTWLGWVGVWAGTAWAYGYFLYYTAAFTASLVLYGVFWKETRAKYERRQAAVIFFVTLIPFVFGSVTDVVMPLLGFNLPSAAALIFLFWGGGLAYAITRYKLMTVDVSVAAREIISTMPDAVFIVMPDAVIAEVNAAACGLTGFSRAGLTGRPLGRLFTMEAEQFSGGEWEKLLEKGSMKDHYAIVRSRSGDAVPVSLSCSVLSGKEGGIIGIVCIAGNISRTIRLRIKDKEIAVEKERAKTLEGVRDGLEKTVGERTMELKKSCDELYEKTLMLERLQKITVWREMEMVKIKGEINALLESAGRPRKYAAPDKIRESGGVK